MNWYNNPESKRFYSNGHAYFPIGDVVNTDEVYKGITTATIISVEEQLTGAIYKVSVTLPKDHPEAVDANGEEELQKTFLMRDKDLIRYNPE